VKRYSSGMYVRLAFAVAAHLEPDILVVDEVLAVGDMEFQKKCIAKMDDVANQGRTVLFVSHNMGAIRNLCDLAVYLKVGQIHLLDTVDNAIEAYVADSLVNKGTTNPAILDPSLRTKGTGEILINSLSLLNNKGELTQEFAVWETLTLSILVENHTNTWREIALWFSVVDKKGDVLGTTIQYDCLPGLMHIQPCQKLLLTVSLQDNVFSPGDYYIHAGILGKHKEILDWSESVLSFTIRHNFLNGVHYDNRIGLFPLRANWSPPQSV
jgi:lipopolysaccharide transport system ATP-binding protein